LFIAVTTTGVVIVLTRIKGNLKAQLSARRSFMGMELKENRLVNLEKNFLTKDELNALVEKLGGLDNVKAILEGEIIVKLEYSPKNNSNKFDQGEVLSVTSNGKIGEVWIDHFEKNDTALSRLVKRVLRSSEFSPTLNQKYQVIILKGDQFINNQISIEYINQIALKNKLSIPPLEVICLIAHKIPEYFEQKGLSSLIITKPVEVDDENEKIDILLRVGYLPSQGRIFLAELRKEDWRFLSKKDAGFVYLLGK